MNQNDTDTNANSFASLFENSLAKMEKLKPGQLVETTIVSISKDSVFLQLSGKSEGVLNREELADADGNVTAREGDPIKVYFLESKNGEMRFTTRISGNKAGSAVLESAFTNKIPVEGLVEKEIKGGYNIKLGESRAFCPYSQMGLRRTEDSSVWIGKHLTFQILEYKENGRNILVSNRAIEAAALAERVEELKTTLSEGMTITGTITSVQDFGAFVDIGGVQALLPVSEIGRDRIEDVRSVLSAGQEIEAQILKLDWKNERFTLSMKRLLSDPWEQALKKYPKNSRHTGTVVRITDFGAFVTLEPGLDGLVHVSELRGEGKYTNVRDAVTVGQSLDVQVLDIDLPRKRIALKPASSAEQEATSRKYLEGDTETYNPFAALLKKK